jgi:hypothetical protein
MAHAINTASALQHAISGAAATVGKSALGVLKAVGGFFFAVANANSRIGLIEELNNLSDVELATKYGIKRDGIVAYVFRDKMI